MQRGFGVLLVVCLCGCATPRTVIELPSCIDTIDIAGQAVRTGARRFELDHTFDLVGTKTTIGYRRAGVEHQTDVWNSQPDGLRAVLGTALAVVGGLLLASGVYEVAAQGNSILDERPFYQTTWGGGMVALGALAVATGWHPPQRVVTVEDACVERR
jgi:hypothetical protein